MTVCVIVAGDDGARTASHALRAAGWGGVHFEANPAAAVRVATGGRATVLNVSRAPEADVDDALTEIGRLGIGHDWRTPPPDLSEDEWAVVYALAEGDAIEEVATLAALTLRTTKNRLATACTKFGASSNEELLAAVAQWRLPRP